MSFRSGLLPVAALFLASLSAFAEGIVEVHGEVVADGMILLSEYTVELFESAGNRPLDRTTLQFGGQFVFSRVEPGQYQVRLLRGHDLVQTEHITASTNSVGLTFRLKGTQPAAAPGGTVDAKRLAHKPNKKAIKQLMSLPGALESGDPNRALQHIRKAIEIDPQFADGHFSLGVFYATIGKDEAKAMESFREALRLDPAHARTWTCLATIYVQHQQWAEAETAARHALDIDPSISKARFLLGFSRLRENHYERDTVETLKRVEEEYPQSRLLLAEAYTRQGNVDAARKVLTTYVADKGAPQREQAQQWLRRLTAAKP